MTAWSRQQGGEGGAGAAFEPSGAASTGDGAEDRSPEAGDGAAANDAEASSSAPPASSPVTPPAPPSEEPSDDDLIARIATARDRGAFRMLFDRYGRKVKAFMIRAGASPEEADEAAQEAMLAVWRRAETFDPARASAAAWMFAIARNKRVDLLRRSARPEPDPEDPSFRPDPPAPADRQLSEGRRDAAVRAALDALTDEQRVVVRLSFYEGCAHSEIAERLDIPLGTVKSRLRLAFGKLRGELGETFRGELQDD